MGATPTILVDASSDEASIEDLSMEIGTVDPHVKRAPFGLECSSDTLAVDWMPTQDFQLLPVSFSDPRTNAPNSLTVPMPHGAICNRTSVEATVYISGAPTLKMP